MSESDLRQDYDPTPLERMGVYWRGSVRRPFWVMLIVFCGLWALFGAVYADDPGAAREVLSDFLEDKSGFILNAGAEESLTWDDVWRSFGADPDALEEEAEELSRALSPEPQRLDATALFLNNALACAVGIVLGLVPFLFLSVWPLAANAVIVGALTGAVLAEGGSLAAVAWGILPHGVLEIPALALSFAMGFALCRTLTRRICRRRNAHPLRAMGCTLLLYVLVVLPLLLAAACIETWITPDLFARAMGL